jgi:anti-anti-sigma regulatory factor
MLRITRLDGQKKATVLRLEGRLTQGDLIELRAILAACVAGNRRVVIDLAGIGFLDKPGAAALVAAERDDVELIGASPFVRELLQEVAS